MEEKLKNLDFNLSVVQEEASHGYQLRLKATWRPVRGWNPKFMVQLNGINPLTGKNVKDENLPYIFTFDKTSYLVENLRYHGTYTLQCFAVLEDGSQILVKEQPVELKYPESCPRLHYTVGRRNGFTKVTMKSNCWEYCTGKVLLQFDGHDQLVYFPEDLDQVYSFYLNTSSVPNIKIIGDSIKIERGE